MSGSARGSAGRVLVVLAVAAAGLAACGTGAGDRSSASSPTVSRDAGSSLAGDTPAAEAPDPAAAVDAAGVRDGEASGGGSSATTAAPDGGPPPLGNLATEPGRDVILTGSIDLGVDEVAPTVAKVVVLVQGLGGVVAGEQSDYASESATSVLTVKVPPEQFRPALNQLAGLGEVSAQNVGREDVTATVVDLDSRIATATISVERLRGYLAQAKTTADVAVLEGELVRRESDLEAMRGQLRSVREQVNLATIVVTVRTLVAEATPSGAGFSDAVAAGGRALVAAASAVALVVGTILLWVPVVLVVALIVWLIARSRRRARPGARAEGADQEQTDDRQPEPVG